MFARMKPPDPVAFVSNEEAEIVLYDEIGPYGITAERFRAALQEVTAPTLHLRINSPGGSVFEALAMYNALREHPAAVVAHIDGLAASAATLVALGAAEVRMAANAFFMIHDPWALAVGSAEELRTTADLLEKIADPIVHTYQTKTGATEEAVRAWMAAETWFTAAEAEAAGFADVVDDEHDLAAAAAALFDLSVYAHTPDALETRGSEPAEPTTRELEKALRDAGLSRTAAARMVAAGRTGQRDAGETHPAPAGLTDEALLTVAAAMRTATNAFKEVTTQ